MRRSLLRPAPDASLVATSWLDSARRLLHGPVAITLSLGLAITGLLAAVARLDYLHEERYLSSLQTSLAASILESQLFDLEHPLLRVLGAATSSPSPIGTFRRVIAALLEPTGPFDAATLLKVNDGHCQLLLHLGAVALQNPLGDVGRSICTTSLKSHTFVTFWSKRGSLQRLGYAVDASGPAGTFVVRVTKALPTDQRLPALPATGFSRLNLAVYFGRSTANSALIETNAAHLPITGSTNMVTEPFGTNVLTIVASAKAPFTGALSQLLAWFIIAAGTLASIATAIIVHFLVARRKSAELAANANQEALRLQEGIAHELQRALLPQELPSVRGIEYGVRYLPEMLGVDVGGDWYDVIEIGDGAIFVSIGDVSGHGLDAATMMGAVRSSIRAFASEDPRPEEVLSRLAGLYARSNERHFATVCCGTIDRVNGKMSFATAGHPPPLLVTGEHAWFVNVLPGPPVGVGYYRYTPVELAFETDTIVLLYTDGLVERRGEMISEGLRRLFDAATPARPIEALLDQVLVALVPSGAHDDVALMAISVQPAAASSRAKTSHSFSFEPDPPSISTARRLVRQDTVGLPDSVRETAALIVTELTTNAILHAKSAYVLTLEHSAGSLRIAVSDFAPETALELQLPDLGATRGRGLPLVDALATDWGVTADEQGLMKTVWCSLALDADVYVDSFDEVVSVR